MRRFRQSELCAIHAVAVGGIPTVDFDRRIEAMRFEAKVAGVGVVIRACDGWLKHRRIGDLRKLCAALDALDILAHIETSTTEMENGDDRGCDASRHGAMLD